MAEKRGNLSINSDNIFPIIKKWLYSDHDIFFRELISNGCDAITKLNKLDMMGEYNYPEGHKNKVEVILDPEKKTLKFTDTGLGMTADEVEEYITQIAFSGATEFLEKYKDKTEGDQIIGHFGLGFYSAFMVADEVHIDTLSYKEGAEPVHWECDGGTEYTMKTGTKSEVGTEITLFLNEESTEFTNEYRAREIIEKYCSFMPTEIFLSVEGKEQEYETIPEEDLKEDDVVVEHIHEDAKTEEREKEDGTKETVEISPAREMVKINKRPVSLSDTHPLWMKRPNDCTDEEYKAFYHKVFHDFKEPLFWIHLNMDYPFNLKGILYFPQINTEYDSIEGTIKLYNNQVFIADNIKEVIPEFLMLLKGVIDCPDLPLNVSRSALQNDGFVQKISSYITKKVADKLTGMCKNDRESYEKYWDDISPFIKFGFIRDQKFAEKIKDYLLFKNMEHKYVTLSDLVPAPASDDDVTTLYYITDEVQQSQYINMFKEQGMDAVILNQNIDSAFITQIEQQNQHIKFKRIDADVEEALKEKTDEKELEDITKALTDLFRKTLGKENLDVHVEKLKDEKISSIITLSEESRRMQDMMKMYGMPGMDPNMFGGAQESLTLNANNSLVQYLFEHGDADNAKIICEQLYDLAMLSHKPLEPEAMTKFIARSNKIMEMLTK
ncbi:MULTISPECIES: molecular chaperone HtpG [Anaerostipes]|uniref:Molecular chaperone HtpG n=1 Tax=Anaerostipes butyraticus TaxID=645466 RepID=A0A916Q6A8_9FIRM|nr:MULTISPECIES: molecular chaperone HtpG [Anaerostipes]GFO85052.1 molecular chaperone HtpG [Anaerostipes butyraticus]